MQANWVFSEALLDKGKDDFDEAAESGMCKTVQANCC